MTEWVNGKIIQIKHWTKNYFSIIAHAPIQTFIAGQFAKIALEINNKKIQRAYSYVNSPCNSNLEFYIVNVPNGKLSFLLKNLKPNDNFLISKKSFGFFIIKEIPLCENLWMFATGTAIGPYLSILEQKENLEHFKKIILIYAVRFVNDLCYLPQLLKLQKKYNNKLHIQAIVSQEKAKNTLFGRIPNLIENGLLESAVGLKLNSLNSHIMLCGNSNMIYDTQILLKKIKNMHKHLKNKPGHITSERYL